MIFIGIDGCPGGWVVAVINGKCQDLTFIEALGELTSFRFDRAAIDIPIGLPHTGYRQCDLAARKLLGTHRSRVFLGARRCIIDDQFKTAAMMNAALHARGEPGISLQLWNLRGKLGEIDVFVRGSPALDIREVHPELVFQRLNGGRSVVSKKSKNGLVFRQELLRNNGFPNIDALLRLPRKLKAKPDDILDACAAAIAARDFGKKYVLPHGYVPHDEYGLPMQIWY